MPAKSKWIQRLPLTIEALSRSQSVAISAKTLAGMMKVSLRTAQRRIQPFADPEYGGMAERNRLIIGLKCIVDDGYAPPEMDDRREDKFRAAFAESEPLFKSGLEFAPHAERAALLATEMADLPDTISLQRYALKITFSDEVDLFRQMFQLVYARLNDEGRFREMIGMED